MHTKEQIIETIKPFFGELKKEDLIDFEFCGETLRLLVKKDNARQLLTLSRRLENGVLIYKFDKYPEMEFIEA